MRSLPSSLLLAALTAAAPAYAESFDYCLSVTNRGEEVVPEQCPRIDNVPAHCSNLDVVSTGVVLWYCVPQTYLGTS